MYKPFVWDFRHYADGAGARKVQEISPDTSTLNINFIYYVITWVYIGRCDDECHIMVGSVRCCDSPQTLPQTWGMTAPME